MNVFTYRQYIECIHKLRLNAVLQLAEEQEEYHIEKKKDKCNKLLKYILKNKQEVAKFINDFIKPREQINSNELIEFQSNYIMKKYKDKNTNYIYELKEKNMFFLIEHQENINNTIEYKILNYCVDIMQEWNQANKMKKTSKYPIIIPIIIYTGNQKWKRATNLKHKSISNYVLKNNKIEIKYNLIDINKLSKEYLIKEKSVFGYIMLIEKYKNRDELKNIMYTIIDKENEKEKLYEITKIIIYMLNEILEEKEQKKLLEKIYIKIKN